MHDKDELDRMIDAALASYGEAGDEVSERVLRVVERRIAQEHAPRRRRWLPWAAALAAAACVLAFFVARPSPRPAQLPGSSARQMQQQTPGSTVAEVKPPAIGKSAKPVERNSAKQGVKFQPGSETAKAEALPKLDVFPTPQPLSEDEEALSFFIQRASTAEVKQLLEAQARFEAPLTIDELEIPPLEPLDKGGR
jgi:hypothetical protein